MNENLQQMLKVSEGRYLRAEETRLFEAYYAQLPQRLEQMRQLEAAEQICLSASVDALFQRFPALLEMPGLRAQTERDLSYLYRSATMAMVQQDLGSLANKAEFVFAIFTSLGLPTAALEFAGHALREQIQQRLSAADWEQVAPYFQALSATRLDHWRHWRDKLPEVVKSNTAYVLRTWPALAQLPDVETHMGKDMRVLLQAVGLAMLSQSPLPVTERKAWLYSYFTGLRFDMEMVYTSYAALPELAGPHLEAETLNALRPWLKLLSEPI
ncbi:MAG: hypothetical protein ACO1RX_08690 [Candidatus Sericytochromatia bacterium]